MSESRYGPKLKRAALSAVVALIAISVGIVIGNFLVDKPLEVIGTRLDAGTVLAIASFAALLFKDTLETAKSFGRYINSGRNLNIGEAFALLAASTVGAAILSVIVVSGQPTCPKSWSKCASKELGTKEMDSRCRWRCIVEHGIPHVEKEIQAAVERGRNRMLLERIAFSPLLFDDAETGGTRTSEGQPDLNENSHGIGLQPDHHNQLTRIVELFKDACRPHPERATFVVTGSSSEVSFKNTSKQVSDELNVRAANLRGHNVKRALRRALDEAGLADVKVERLSWDRYDSIQRRALDGVHYDSLPDPQYQARSVIVQVKDIDVCFDAPQTRP